MSIRSPWAFSSFCLLVLSLLLVPPALAQQWTGIIAPSRAANWANVGAAGGNPQTGGLPSDSWPACATTACTALTTPANVTATNINTAIAGAPAHTYIQLPAGTFTMSTGLVWQTKTGVELRGAGSNSTLLIFAGDNGCSGVSADVCFEDSSTNYQGGPSNVANWTAGYSLGATTISLSSVPNLSVGQPIILDQVDDSSDSGDIYICLTTNTCSYAGSGGFSRPGPPSRAQSQMVTVTQCDGNSTPGHACSSGTNITISPGLYMPNWNAHPGTSLPQAWWSSSPSSMVGIRNVSMDHTASNPADGVSFFNCINCWDSGTRSIMTPTGSNETHVLVWNSPRVTVQNNYFYQTGSTPNVRYGVALSLTSDTLVQNNIFEQVEAPVPLNGSCSGCVVAYNFDVNSVFTPSAWLEQGEFLHSVSDNVLFEGNEGAGIYSDNAHGTHHFITVFRTAANGYQQNLGALPTGSTEPLQLDAFSRFYNVIGNVWGSPALPDNKYETVEPSTPTGTEIYVVGYGNSVPNDSNTPRTLMLWGNYSIVTQSSDSPANSGIRFVSSEVPSAITNFANPVPSNDNLPASFYISSQPSWWSSSIPWPAIGPDVTGGNAGICNGGTNKAAYVTGTSQCPGSTVSTIGGHINAIPAMNCYLNVMAGSPIGSGSALAFDANACYASGSATQPPTSPSGLSTAAR
jgi:hypothetical protein